MKLYISSCDHDSSLPENYLKVIKKYAKNGKVELEKGKYHVNAVIEVDSLDVLPKFEKDIRKARGIVRSLDFADIHGLIFNTISKNNYSIEIYDFYRE